MTDTNETGNVEVNIFCVKDFLCFLSRRKKALILLSFLQITGALFYVVQLRGQYSALTTIAPPNMQQANVGGIINQINPLIGAAVGANAGLKYGDEFYVALLNSRSVREEIISKLDLKSKYGMDADNALRELSAKTQISSDKKTGIISISVDDEIPSDSASIANAHIEVLRNMLKRLATTEASQRRKNIEYQYAEQKKILSELQMEFDEKYKEYGVSSREFNYEVEVKSLLALKAQRMSLDLKIKSAQSVVTKNNQGYKDLINDLAAVDKQISILSKGYFGSESKEDATERVIKALKSQQLTVEVLAKQLEASKLDEIKDAPLIQQIDVAVPPRLPSKPKRTKIFVLLCLLSVANALFLVGGYEARLKIKRLSS